MHLHKIALAVISSQFIFACGGESPVSISTPTPPSSSPQVNTIIKTGVITGFGSIYVDGQRFLTDTTIFDVNGQSGQTIEQLQVGMKISMSVQQSDDEQTPTASSLHYDNDAEGVVTAIDRNNQQLEVAGMVVRYSDLTHFIGITENSLAVNDRIEISGYLDGAGVLVATYIELDDDTTNEAEQYTTGIVANLDTTQQTFTLQDVTVNYSSATVMNINDGMKVKVEGNIVNDVFVAMEVEVIDETFYLSLSDDDVTRIEKEGIVTAIDSTNNTISVDGVLYQIATDVVFEGRSNIQVNDFIEVYLDPVTNQITKVETKDKHLDSDGKVKGIISVIDMSNQTITVNDQIYVFANTTRMEDDDDRYFSFNSLTLNDRVEIAFVIDSQNNNIIQRIEREDDAEYNEEWELESRVFTLDVATQTLTVNGVNVVLNNTMRLVIDDIVTDLSTFLSALTNNNSPAEIEVEGAFNNNGEFVIKKVELETDHNSDHDAQQSSDNDQQGIGYVEFEDKVSSIINDTSFMLNGREIRIDDNTELELNDQRVSVTQFMAAIQVGVTVDIEGTWVDGAYIYAYEAEIESDDDD